MTVCVFVYECVRDGKRRVQERMLVSLEASVCLCSIFGCVCMEQGVYAGVCLFWDINKDA